MHQVKERQSTQEDKFGQDECFFELGGLDYNVVRFFKSLIKVRKGGYNILVTNWHQ